MMGFISLTDFFYDKKGFACEKLLQHLVIKNKKENRDRF